MSTDGSICKTGTDHHFYYYTAVICKNLAQNSKELNHCVVMKYEIKSEWPLHYAVFAI